jgi:hypothetical protein
MPEDLCPKCGGTNLRLSHTRGYTEKAKKIFGWRAFRCRAEGCNWRGLIKVKSSDEVAIGYSRKYGKLVFIFLLFCTILYLCISLALRLVDPFK